MRLWIHYYKQPAFLCWLCFLFLVASIAWHFELARSENISQFWLNISLGIVVFIAFLQGILLFWWHSFTRHKLKQDINFQLDLIENPDISELFFHPQGLVPWLETKLSEIRSSYANLERVSHLISFINYSLELTRQLKLALCLAHEIFPETIISVFLWKNGNMIFATASRRTTRGTIEELPETDYMVIKAKEQIEAEIDIEKLRAQAGKTFNLPLKKATKNPKIAVMPLILWNRVLGVIVYNFIAEKEFSKNDRIVASLLNRHISVFIENHLLFKEITEKQRIDHEIELAKKIQEDSLPKEITTFPGFSISFYFQPCHEISGDYYDIIPLTTDRLLICIADVSGKGLPAALFMSKLQILVRVLADTNQSPAALLTKLSSYLVKEQMGTLFATMFACIVQKNNDSIIFSNAGHCKPLIVRSKAKFVEEINIETGIPLGLFEPTGEEYADQKIDLLPGDGVFLFSDGLPDLVNSQRERLGIERIKRILEQDTELKPKAMIDFIIKEINKFRGKTPLEDDITLVYFKLDQE